MPLPRPRIPDAHPLYNVILGVLAMTFISILAQVVIYGSGPQCEDCGRANANATEAAMYARIDVFKTYIDALHDQVSQLQNATMHLNATITEVTRTNGLPRDFRWPKMKYWETNNDSDGVVGGFVLMTPMMSVWSYGLYKALRGLQDFVACAGAAKGAGAGFFFAAVVVLGIKVVLGRPYWFVYFINSFYGFPIGVVFVAVVEILLRRGGREAREKAVYVPVSRGLSGPAGDGVEMGSVHHDGQSPPEYVKEFNLENASGYSEYETESSGRR